MKRISEAWNPLIIRKYDLSADGREVFMYEKRALMGEHFADTMGFVNVHKNKMFCLCYLNENDKSTDFFAQNACKNQEKSVLYS